MKIKTSKKLNNILNEILSMNNGDRDILGDLKPECFVNDQDKCRSDHFAESIENGIKLASKALKYNKPIYCVYDSNLFLICYFVNDLAGLTKIFNKLLKSCSEREHVE